MNRYEVTFARSARKELEKLSGSILQRVFVAIEKLELNPRPRGCRKLTGKRDLWRVRVGNYRIVYSINDSDRTVDIVVVRHRSQAYE